MSETTATDSEVAGDPMVAVPAYLIHVLRLTIIDPLEIHPNDVIRAAQDILEATGWPLRLLKDA